MPTYTWKLQYSQHYPDQFQQMGTIDKEKAVEEFQLFPWDKEIDDYKRSQDNPTVPKIVFDSDDKRQLVISSTSNKGYNAEYTNFATNKCSDFYLSSNFEKKNYTPEEIIEFFFDNTLEPKLKLQDVPKPIDPKSKEEKEEKKSKNIEFNFKPSLKPLFSFNLLIWVALSTGYFILSKDKHWDLPRLGIFFFLITWPMPLLLHLSYYLKNYGAKVIIDTSNHNLTYVKGSKEIKFNRDDIFRCQVTYSPSTRLSMCEDYSYVWFILNDRTYVSITCFIADPTVIVETLNCKFETKKRNVPFLPI